MRVPNFSRLLFFLLVPQDCRICYASRITNVLHCSFTLCYHVDAYSKLSCKNWVMKDQSLLPMPANLRSPRASSGLSSFQLVEPDGLSPPEPHGITALTVNIPASKMSSSSGEAKRPPARWWTPEFIFYYLVACVVIPWMVWVPVSLSSRAFLSPPRSRQNQCTGRFFLQLHTPTTYFSARGCLQAGSSAVMWCVLPCIIGL